MANEKILICDDEGNMVKMISFLLKKDGYDVVSVADGMLMPDAVRTHQPQIILLDLALPNKDGYQILQELNADASTASIPVIVMSGYEKPEYVEGARQLGARDYLVKPFKVDLLLEKVRHVLQPS